MDSVTDEGLPFTVVRTHGEATDKQEQIERWLFENDLDHETLEEQFDSNELPEPIQEIVRSAGGPDEPWNRTTLCAFHHHRGVHAGEVQISGRAPYGLLFELGGERWLSGDVRM